MVTMLVYEHLNEVYESWGGGGEVCSGAIGKPREEGKKAIRTIALSELPNRNGRTAARVCLAPAK